MLIIPLHKKLSRRNFPLVTLLLILANVFVYLGLQGGDTEVEMEAARYYHESGLEEREWQWLDSYVPPQDQAFREDMKEADALEEAEYDPELVAMVRSRVVESHPDFLDAAQDGAFAEPGTDEYNAWHSDRRDYEALIDRSFTRRYLMRYDDFDPVTALTHMFMHGGVGHLVGNMVFLLLLGILVEGALGRGLFLASYLVAGFGAASASLAVHWGLPTGMLGASGAIAGLMGLFTVLYGRLRVRFFYWVWVYFDYVRAPAIILLPAWLGWELLQFLMADGTNVAYEAHMGGIVTGALLAFGVRQLDWQRDDFLEEESQRDDDRETLASARADIAELRVPQAKHKLRPLLERHPGDTAVLKAWYGACKLKADDPEVNDAARRILALKGEDSDERQLVIDTFREHRRRAGMRMDGSQALQLASRLIHWGALDEGRLLLNGLLRKPRDKEGLATACLKLANKLSADGRGDEARPYVEQVPKLTEDPALLNAARNLG
ncbi:membrane associated rhomboid family serine protease [Halospina denitrificans]|uniref:Membrane associated rhomboid family serine protease n=1 Tax=Halospina denitrificans TaxID=332522 RepID=A0A4R7JMX5_9GAMM|nr:rhomboid family intramembrane serine protease [Halospina denitrificans]TDT38537.1 membrane associated rhomboid family serine protease [Halospina denitrificans]